jgi:hypothetical protein
MVAISQDVDTIPAVQAKANDVVAEKYFACKSAEECINDLGDKQEQFVKYITSTGRLYFWRNSFQQLNNGLFIMGGISRYGIEGELLNVPVNVYRNDMDYVVSMTTNERLDWEPAAQNTDFKSQAQCTLSKGLLEYYQKHKHVDNVDKQGVRDLLGFGEAHVLALWDEFAGDNVTADADTKELVKTGDVEYIAVLPNCVVRDCFVTEFDKNQWFLCKVNRNKYDLCKKYPSYAPMISNESLEISSRQESGITYASTDKSDYITVNYFMHKPTPSLPFGRWIVYIQSNIVLEDDKLPSKKGKLPLISMMVSDTRSTNFGYTTFADCLSIQRMIDVVVNAICTNISTFATINILMPEGCDLSPSDIAGGLNFLKYKPLPGGAGEPKALVLLATPKEAYSFLDWLINIHHQLAGLNSTVKGVNDETVQSGSALALRATQSILFNSLVKSAYIQFAEQLGSATLELLQDNASIPRLGLIAGNMEKAYLKEFSNKDIDQIDRVTINVGNPLLQTPEGKMEMANLYKDFGFITSPQDLGEVLQTGNLKVMTQGPHAEMMSIYKENELLSQGKKCKVIKTQNHPLFIKEHMVILSNPELVNTDDPGSLNDQIVANALEHIQEHITQWKQLSAEDPELCALLNIPNIAGGAQSPAPPGGKPSQPTGPSPQAGPKPMPKPGMAPQGAAAGMNGGQKVAMPTSPLPAGGVPMAQH